MKASGLCKHASDSGRNFHCAIPRGKNNCSMSFGRVSLRDALSWSDLSFERVVLIPTYFAVVYAHSHRQKMEQPENITVFARMRR